ncbi:MAG: copper amine oxidase N-terminal domain-containing protein [Eubacteriales bacterium]|nr:copper amine oxidase N-terminal domain-containing protein [Eubacteriales bacterium]
MNKKRVLIVMGALALAFSMSVSAFAAGRIFVDLEEVITDTPSQIINSRTMVPVRAITEMIGYDVKWVPEGQKVEVYEKSAKHPAIIMAIGNTSAYYGKYDEELGDTVGYEAVLDSPPVIVNNRTMVPLRFISEAVGYTVDYNVDSEDVYLFSPRYMENQIGEGIGEDIQAGEGIGETKPITNAEMNYVLSFRTKSWLELKPDQKEKVISIIARWWEQVDGHIVEDFDAVLRDLDHQMETYSRNKVDEGVFQTACDIYDIELSHYIKG